MAEPTNGTSPVPTIIAVNISTGGIPKMPLEVAHVELTGLRGDDHDHEKHRTSLQALCLLDVEDLDDLRAEGFDVGPGATGENITCRNLDLDSLEVGVRLRFSGGVECELTKRRQPCFVLDAIDPRLKEAARGRIGFYARVITTGEVRPGETIAVVRASVPAEVDSP